MSTMKYGVHPDLGPQSLFESEDLVEGSWVDGTVEVDAATWSDAVEARSVAAAEAKAAREKDRADHQVAARSASVKLSQLGLTDEEVQAITGINPHGGGS